MLEKVGAFLMSLLEKEDNKRINRRQFFMIWLGTILFFLFISGIITKFFGNTSSQIAFTLADVVLLATGLGVYWFVIGPMTILRSHDLNRDGKKEASLLVLFYTVFAIYQYGSDALIYVWGVLPSMGDYTSYILLFFALPLFGYILYMMFAPGTKGDNRYGPEAPNTWMLPKKPVMVSKQEQK